MNFVLIFVGVEHFARTAFPCFPSAEGAGCWPQWFRSSRQICTLVCVAQYREARISCNLFIFRMRPASPGKMFATPKSQAWAETTPPAAFVHCRHQQHFVREFLIWPSLLTHSLMHRFTGCFWWKRYQNCWKKFPWDSGETCSSSTTGLRLISHATSENIPPQLTRIDVSGGAQPCLCLLGQCTAHHWNSSYGTICKPYLLITSSFRRGSWCHYLWGSSNHQAETWHHWKHTISVLSWSVAVILNIYSKLAK